MIERDAGDSKQINITINLRCVCSQCHEKKEKEVVVKENVVVVEEEKEKEKEESAREKWLKREEKALKDALVKPEELVRHRKSIVPRFLRSIKRKSLTLLEDDIKKNEEKATTLKSAMRSRSPSPSRKTVNFNVDTEAVKDEMKKVTASYVEDKNCIRLEYCNDLHIHEEERRSESDLITVESLIPIYLQHPLPAELLTTLRQYIENKYYLQEHKRHEELEKETHRPLFKKSKLLPIFKAAAAGLKLAMIAL